MSADKKEHIILTAIDLFATKGFEGTSIREIAAAANVNLAMINYYFGSKEKLFESIIEYKARHSRVALEELVQDAGLSPIQKIDATIDGYVERLFGHRNFHRLIQQELITHTRTTLQTHIVNNIIYPNSRAISHIIEEGIKNGDFKEVDPRLTTITLIGTINQILLSTRYCSKMLSNSDDPDYNPYEDASVKDRVKKHLKTLLHGHLLKN